MAGLNLPQSLEAALIPSMPRAAYYIPNFINQAEEEYLMKKISSAPLPQWKALSHRRLQTYPSALTPSNMLLATPLPDWLTLPIIPRLLSLPLTLNHGHGTHIFSSSPHSVPNHVLVNEYEAGQGILPHEDGSAYYPVVATVSLGSAVVLDIYEKTPEGASKVKPKWRILQESRSLLISAEGIYEDSLHGIFESTVDEGLRRETIANWDLLGSRETFASGRRKRGTRISLTFRDVIKVKKMGKAFGLLGK